MKSPWKMDVELLTFTRVSFAISRMFGSMPLHMEIKNNKMIHNWSYVGVIQTSVFFTFTVYTIISYFQCFPNCLRTANDLPTVTRFSQAGHFFILLFLGTLSVFIHVINVRCFPGLFKRFSDVKVILEKIKKSEDKQKTGLYMKTQYITLFGYVFVVTCIVLVSYFNNFSVMFILVSMTWVMANNFCIMMQFTNFACLLYQQFAFINNYIANSVTGPFSFKSKKLHKIHPEQETIHIRSVDTQSIDCINVLYILRTSHSQLCDIIQAVMSTFQFQILSFSIIVFVEALAYIYLSIVGHIDMKIEYTLPTSLCTYFFVGCILIEYATISAISTKATNEAQKTGVILYKLSDSKFESTVREEVKLFSIQLLQSETNFSVCGFFTLDLSFLHSMAAALTTYLVILIQMRKSPEATDQKLLGNSTLTANNSTDLSGLL